jgi:hypothetical protein
MQEVTNELNDLSMYDILENKWYKIEDDNKNTSPSGSPKNKNIM